MVFDLFKNTELLQIFIGLFGSVWGIYTFRIVISQKTAMTNFEQIYKYFSKEKLDDLASLPVFAQDMACETVSYFKGFKFKDLEQILLAGFHLKELLTILKLHKAKIIVFNKDKNMVEISDKYLKKYLIKWTKTARKYEILNWIIFLIFIMMVLIPLATIFATVENGYGLLVAIIFIGIWEIPMLLNIDKRKSVEWFQNEGIRQISEIQNKKLEKFIGNSL